MSKKILGLIMIALVAAIGPEAATAEDWSGQPTTTPSSGSLGPYDNGHLITVQLGIRCDPGSTPPPCTPGQTPNYNALNPGTNISSFPAAAANNTNIGIFISGAYPDATAPTGLSVVEGSIPLSAFARSTTVDALTGTVTGLGTTVGLLSGSVSALNASMGTLSTQFSSLSIRFDQFQQQVHLEQRDLRQGVAMSLAMDGVGDLGTDERVAISMNVGTYGGQNGIAAGVAFRAAQHLTFNAGVGTGVNGGLVGGRAGVRMAW